MRHTQSRVSEAAAVRGNIIDFYPLMLGGVQSQSQVNLKWIYKVFFCLTVLIAREDPWPYGCSLVGVHQQHGISPHFSLGWSGRGRWTAELLNKVCNRKITKIG